MYFPECNVYNNHGANILNRIGNVIRQLDSQKMEQLKEDVLGAERIFIVGSGRSGLVGRLFAMRVMHMGIEVYVVGETNTPRIGSSDLLVAISGSGTTPSVISAAEKANEIGAKVVGIIVKKDQCTTPLSNCVNYLIRLERRQVTSQERWAFAINRNQDKKISLLPMGSLFELSTLIFLETLLCGLIEDEHITESEMKHRHTILE
ncbi:MAG: 6-phospho-3-hexuloisomerase [Sedimenticola sp.]